MRHLVSLAALLALAGPAARAQAQDWLGQVSYGGKYELTLQDDYVRRKTGAGPSFNEGYGEVEASLYLNLGQRLSINSTVKGERVRDHADTAYFRDEALYAEELYAAYDFGYGIARAGKFHTRFGIGWHVAPGLYGDDFAQDYEITEKLGSALDVPLPVPQRFGDHVASIEVFRSDTTVLSRAIGAQPSAADPLTTRPRRLRLGDGGVGNTSGLHSYVGSLTGRHLPGLDGLTYSVAVSHQEGSAAGGERDERGIALGATWEFNLTRFIVTPVVEIVQLKGAQGTDQNADYALAGIGIEYPALGWSAALLANWRRLHDGTLDPQRDRLLTGSVGYDLRRLLAPGFGIEAGVRQTMASGDTQWGAGAALKYERAF